MTLGLAGTKRAAPSMEPPVGFVHLSLFKQDNRVLSANKKKERLFYSACFAAKFRFISQQNFLTAASHTGNQSMAPLKLHDSWPNMPLKLHIKQQPIWQKFVPIVN